MDQKVVFVGPERVEVQPCPRPEPQSGQILVRTTRTIISVGTEMTILHGQFTPGSYWDRWVKFPLTPGYMNCGIVEAVGTDVSGLCVGDRVASEAGHASLALVAASSATVVPDGVSDEQAAFARVGLITQVGIRAAEPKPGDQVVVIGTGLLGQLVVQYARAMGAWKVIAVDSSAARLDLARRLGATDVVCGTAEQAVPKIMDLTGGGADCVYDVTGHPLVLARALAMVRRFGTVVLLGDAAQTEGQSINQELLVRGVRLIGAHAHHPPAESSDFNRWPVRRVQELFLWMLGTGTMRVTELITHRFPAADAPAAYAMLCNNRQSAMGVVLEWSGT